MPLDKIGRNGDRTTPVYSGIKIANLPNSFLRRGGGNTAIGATDMNSNIVKHVADPLSNQVVASKNYADTNSSTTAGGVVSGDIKLIVGFDLVRSLRCNDLTKCKKFTFLLVTDTNMLSYCLPDSGIPVPVKITTDGCFAILINQLPMCDFSQVVILRSQPIDMDQHSVMIVMSSVNELDVVNKAYADRIKSKTTTGNIPNTVMTDHTLFTFPAAFASGKKKICEMWVQRLADKWIATSSPMFATAWTGFHKFFRVPSLMTLFTGFPPVVGLAHFVSTM